MLMPFGGRRKSPCTSPQGRLYFISFGINGPIIGTFENGVLLMYTLEGVSSVANFITASEESQ